MNIFVIALSEVKRTFKNKVVLFLLIIMPVMMVALMGYALAPFLNPNETKSIEKFNVLYVNHDDGEIGQRFDTLIKDEGSNYFNLITPESDDVGDEMISNNYDEAIIIPGDLTEKVKNFEEINIIHLSSGDDKMKDSMLSSFVQQFVKSVNHEIAIIKVAEQHQVELDMDEIRENIQTTVTVHELNDTLTINSFQFFGASMLIFFLLTSSMGLGMEITNDRNNKIFTRISSYPVSKNQYLLGKTLGNSIISILQAISVIVLTHILFKVNWGSDYVGLALVVLAVIFISSGISVIFSSMFKSSKTLSTVLIVFYWMLTFISGAFTPIPAFEDISKFILNKWAFESITSFMRGNPLIESIHYIALLIGLGVILWLLGVYLYRRRGSNE